MASHRYSSIAFSLQTGLPTQFFAEFELEKSLLSFEKLDKLA